MEETLGEVIARNRIRKGLSQRELALKVKVSNSTIARIERNDFNAPTGDVLRAIAKELDVDYNYLQALNRQIDDEPDIRQIQRAARNMSPEDRERMLGILRLSFHEAFENTEADENL